MQTHKLIPLFFLSSVTIRKTFWENILCSDKIKAELCGKFPLHVAQNEHNIL